MATDIPAWLDASYVRKILRNADKDDSIDISGVNVKAATAKGDNYASDMYRVSVDISRVEDGRKIKEHKSLIVKIEPNDGMRQELVEGIAAFDTEFAMMSVTLPKMNEYLAKLQLTSLSARCFYIQYEKPTHLVIEDLAPRGFEMADRHAGLDLDHCVLALRHLGRFHASSIALQEKDPKAWTKYKKGMFHKDQPPSMIRFFTLGAKALADEATKWPELNPRIVEKLHKLSNIIYEKGCEAALYQEDDFNVLNHGDFWVNNMMFHYDERRRPVDYMFVDFQFANYGSPAIDVLYFLGTSPAEDVRHHARDSLLREYHISLSETMSKLKCKTAAPTFEKLHEILKKRAFCEVISTFTVLPVVVLDKSDEVDFNELLKPGAEYANPSYRGKTYRRIMTRLLPWFDSFGLLDE